MMKPIGSVTVAFPLPPGSIASLVRSMGDWPCFAETTNSVE